MPIPVAWIMCSAGTAALGGVLALPAEAAAGSAIAAASMLLAYLPSLRAQPSLRTHQRRSGNAFASTRAQSSSAHLDLIADSVHAMIGHFAVNGQCTYVNAAGYKYFGVGKHEVVGKTLRDLYGERVYSTIGPHFERAWLGETVIYERESRRDDGDVVHFEVRLVPQFSAAGRIEGCVALALDITASKRLLAELAQAQSQLENAVQGAGLSLWEWCATNGAIHFDKAHQRILGGGRGASQRTLAEARAMVHPDDLPAADHAFRTCMRHGLYFAELRVRRPNGSYVWVQSRGSVAERGLDGRVLRVRGVNLDVHGKKSAFLALAGNEQRLKVITEGVPAMIAQIDARMHLVYCNTQYAAWFGKTPEQVTGTALVSLTGLARHEEIRPHLEAAMAGAAEKYVHEVTRADGNRRWIEVHVEPWRLPEGGIAGVFTLATDITDEHNSARNLGASEARFRALTAMTSDWYWEQDADFRFTRFDGPALREFGVFTAVSVIGTTRWELGARNMSEEDWRAHRALLDQHLPFRNLILERTSTSGGTLYQEISGDPMFDDFGGFIGYRGAGKDVTGRFRADERILHLAYHDSLTGLPNRQLVQDRIARALAISVRDSFQVAVMFVDLDHFKDVNDSLGHEAGDEVLRACAKRIQGCLRESDSVGRFGGDEFVVLLPDIGGPADAAQVARKLVDEMRAPFILGEREIRIAVSAGIAMAPVDGTDASTLIRSADAAMYAAKRAGRSDFRFFTKSYQAEAAQRLMLESDLRRAFECREFLLEYQPQVRLETGEIYGVEALLRWEPPSGHRVSPAEFIPVAEQIGLIEELGDWVMLEACTQASAWRSAGLAGFRMSVNVSARQISTGGFADSVRNVLNTTGLPPGDLEIELTEGLMLENRAETQSTLAELRSMGIRLSLDDFGTGYSSLSYLKRFPVDAIKIDQSFVRDIATSSADIAMLDAILTLARGLGLDVIAEGVESEQQAVVLRMLRCSLVQGYLFSRPLSAVACAAFLRAHAGRSETEARASLA